MSEELNEPMEEQVEDVVEEAVEETTVEETQDPDEDRESFLNKLRAMGKKFVESNKSGEEEVEEAEETEEVKEVRDADSIPTEFTEAARKAGWGDDQITEFAGDYDDDELKALVSALFMDDESGEESEDSEGKEEEKETSDDVDVDPKIQAYLKKQMEELKSQHKKELDDLKKGLGEVEQERQVKEIQRIQKTTDTFFDKLGEEFPVFGKTEELTVFPKGTPQEGQVVPVGEAYKARNDVFRTAWKFKQMGSDWQDALNDAWYLYRGKNMEKELHNKLVKDLKRNEKRLSPKRTPQNTQKTYDNPVEEKREFIREAARKSGMSI